MDWRFSVRVHGIGSVEFGNQAVISRRFVIGRPSFDNHKTFPVLDFVSIVLSRRSFWGEGRTVSFQLESMVTNNEQRRERKNEDKTR